MNFTEWILYTFITAIVSIFVLIPLTEDPDVQKAAAVIQASFRGFKTRNDSSAVSGILL